MALRDLRLLDTPPSASLDRLTRMASRLFGLPIAAVSLTDTDRQWFKSRVGVEHQSVPREKAPCAQVAITGQSLVVEDFLTDPVYQDSLLARMGIRFYAGAPLTTAEGHGLGAICVLGTEPRQIGPTELNSLEDLASMVMAQIELQHAFGRIDPISGLPNRRQFLEDLEDSARDQSGATRIAILLDLVGLDQLGQASRVLGPSVLDDLVQGAAWRLRRQIAPTQTAYHVGPTQLAYLAPSGTDLCACTDSLSAEPNNLQTICGPNAIGTLVIGVAPFRLGETLPLDVLRIAQGAAQDARTAGRLVAVHSKAQDFLFERSFTLRRDLRRALETGDQFFLAYQPRIDAASGRCVAVEALMRWSHPEFGPISPAEFIPLVEQSRLAQPVTAWVLDTAVKQLAAWRASGLDLAMSINISADNLRDSGFAATIEDILNVHDVGTRHVELEITETAIMADVELALEQLKQLDAAGLRIAIDDFGTGYSSLSYLQRLPVHVIKIDRLFTSHLDTDARQLSLVTMMVSLARHLGCRTVAEGVETAAAMNRLKRAGCDELQGFFFAQPMTSDVLRPWLLANDRDQEIDLVGSTGQPVSAPLRRLQS